MEMNVDQKPSPSKIMQIGTSFWASKTLLAAVKLKLFTFLSGRSASAAEIKEALKLKTTTRHVHDWLDALVVLGFLRRNGVEHQSQYFNNADADLFLDKGKPSYIGGMLEMQNNRGYSIWGTLEEALLTGNRQNEVKDENSGFFIELYKSPERLSEFVNAMSGVQAENFRNLTEKFDFGQYRTIADIGGADAFLSVMIARKYPSVEIVNFDRPPLAPLAEERIAKSGLGKRIEFVSGDFFKDELPTADVIIMGNILHDYDESGKALLIKKAYKALRKNGVFIVIENIIDNDRRENVFGMLMSLYMLVELGDAFDYTFNEFDRWVSGAGFRKTEFLGLAGPASAGIAYK